MTAFISRFPFGLCLTLLLIGVFRCGGEKPVDSTDESENSGGRTFKTVLQDDAGGGADSTGARLVDFTGRNFLNP